MANFKKLSEHEELEFNLYSLPLSRPDFNINKLFRSFESNRARVSQGEKLSTEEQIIYLKQYAAIRYIALLEPYKERLEKFNITPALMQKCCDIRNNFEKSNVKKTEKKDEVRLFKGKNAAAYGRDELISLFSRFGSNFAAQIKPRRN